MTAPWYIVNTAPRREAAVYRALIDTAADIWLPMELRVSREHRHVKRRRRWWCAVLPGQFFAALDPGAVADIPCMRHCQGVERDMTGNPVTISHGALMAFRGHLERETLRTLSTVPKNTEGHQAVKFGAGKGKRKPRASRKLQRTVK